MHKQRREATFPGDTRTGTAGKWGHVTPIRSTVRPVVCARCALPVRVSVRLYGPHRAPCLDRVGDRRRCVGVSAQRSGAQVQRRPVAGAVRIQAIGYIERHHQLEHRHLRVSCQGQLFHRHTAHRRGRHHRQERPRGRAGQVSSCARRLSPTRSRLSPTRWSLMVRLGIPCRPLRSSSESGTAARE